MNYLQSYQSELKFKQLNSYVCLINNNNFNFDFFFHEYPMLVRVKLNSPIQSLQRGMAPWGVASWISLEELLLVQEHCCC